MNVVTAFTHLVEGYMAARERRRTERLVNSLSPEIRKDIGWPRDFNVRSSNADGPYRN